jgi:iron complex transport system ATP-binding protein
MPLLSAEGLHVVLERTPILHDVGFHIEDGQSVGLLGPNGSGKTTLLRTISGLLPYSGSLMLRGRALHAWTTRELARQIAFVRQSHALTFDFSVEELVLLGRAPHKGWIEGWARRDREIARDALDEVDLGRFAARSALTLSGGELQRVFLAQALVQEAEVLLLDEPTAHLDVHYRFEFMERIRALTRSGRTTITVFHDLELAARYSDHVIVLQNGTVAAAGEPRTVLTPDLIAAVFRMHASLLPDPDGTVFIHYHCPI